VPAQTTVIYGTPAPAYQAYPGYYYDPYYYPWPWFAPVAVSLGFVSMADTTAVTPAVTTADGVTMVAATVGVD